MAGENTVERFVFELGVEELPAAYLEDLMHALESAALGVLEEARLAPSALSALGTPRRLVLMGQVAAQQEARVETIRGPKASAAGAGTPALEGFLRRTGVAADALRVNAEGYLFVEKALAQASAAEVLPTALARVVEALPLPRSMRWGSGDARFLRPVRWVFLALEDTVLEPEVFGIKGGGITYGNRTDHPGPIPLHGVDDYRQALTDGCVMLDPEARRQAIVEEGRKLARSVGAVMVEDAELLQEVSALVEWPSPFLGRFDDRYLAVPEPVLVTSMKVHQRYFPLRIQDAGGLYAGFIGVRNGIGADLDAVRRGNQKVLRARLEDAWFFYHEDLKERLEDHRPRLDRVVFHAKLGTLGEKIQRMQALLAATRNDFGLGTEAVREMERAITLAKCDLTTHVVMEFPELQGTMGGIYARRQGEPDAVWQAIRDQYRPSFWGDSVPQTLSGQMLSLLDRLDTLAGAEVQGIKVTGSEDPFGLRRAALGVARIIIEGQLPPTVHLERLSQAAVSHFHGSPEAVPRLRQFVRQRAKAYLGEAYAMSGNWADALLAAPAPWQTLLERYQLLQGWAAEPGFEDVAAAFKRVDRVLDAEAIADLTPVPGLSGIEARLYQAVAEAATAPDGEAWWRAASGLVPTVQAFFEEVLVNDPDPEVRGRRHRVLAALREVLGRELDFSQL